jgi:RHS repeat-associated protein
MGSSSSYYNPPPVPTRPCTNQCTGQVIQVPVNQSCPAGYTGSPVLLATGQLYFQQVLLRSEAIGAGGFSFALNYLVNPPGTTSSDGSVGVGFNHTHNILLSPTSGVMYFSGVNTQEEFASVSGGGYSSANNNTCATLFRTGEGTSSDQFTMISGTGNVSQYYGFHSSISTPGRLKNLTDRFGNTLTHNWTSMGGQSRLTSVTDGYGRVSNFDYLGSDANYRMQQITDFWGRQTNFQYDSAGRLVAVVGPSITRGADGNTFPNGTAYVYQYDVSNPRPERQNDLIKIWYPNQVAPYLDSSRVVDVASVYASATPRQQISYYNDPTDAFHYGKIQQLIESPSGSGSVGSGAYGYIYLNTGLPTNKIDPSDPIVTRTIATDRNGNQVAYDFNADQMLVHKQVFATRNKNSLEASSWETWTQYNNQNLAVLEVMPEGNSIAYEYEDESNTIKINGIPYAPRIGLLKSMTKFPGNTIGIPGRAGSNGQTQLTELYFYDPLFNNQCAVITAAGNPIDSSGTYFTPQNGGTTPTNSNRSRYATITYYDYQKDTTNVVKNDTALQQQLGLTATQISQLIQYVNNQMNVPFNQGPLPGGFKMGIGDVNGEGTGKGTGIAARHQGAAVEITYPSVRQLVPNTETGDPWIWQEQVREELYTNNARGQVTTYTNPEGNLTIYVRYPENNPDGDNDVDDPSLSNHQYGRVQATYVDADPSTVMTLVGEDGDMITFIGNKIPRTNTPGVYQNLTTTHQGTTGCSNCNYDPLGNVLTTVDARGNMTQYDRNELGEVYRVTTPAPYSYQVETSYDANRNVIQIDTEDMEVEYESTDPSDPSYAQFVPTGSGSTANVPMMAGSGGSVRPGWFSNLYSYDLVDNKTEDDLDATGSSPSSLVTTYVYDFNQNLIKVTKPQGNTVEYDYDERNMRIATRVGYDSATDEPGSVTVNAYDGNGNLLDTVGPAERGTPSQSLTVVIDDAFYGSVNMTFVGDWVVQNTYDGFDRLITSTDAVGGTIQNTYDPVGSTIQTNRLGTVGGPTPTDRTGVNNVLLSSIIGRYDEAGRQYESQQDVFLNTGLTDSGMTILHDVPSGRTVTHTGGGLASNSTVNNNTGTVTLTTGGSSYVLTRQVFDRAGRLTLSAADNTAQTSYAYDGADRQLTITDALGNVTTNSYDANGNVIGATRAELCTISSSIAAESFGSLMSYDVMNRLVVQAQQGADGSLTGDWTDEGNTLFTLYGYDSRGNRTNLIDPKQNTTIYTFDGASRQLQTQQNLRTDGKGTEPVVETVTTQQFYDGNSRLIKLLDDNGGNTQYAYDTQDRLSVMTFHDGSTRTYVYDEASDITGYTDENGTVSANTFDPLGRKTVTNLTLALGVEGTTAQGFQYDGLSRQTYGGDSIGEDTTAYVIIYDSLNRIIEEAQTYASDTRYVTHDQWTSQPATDLTYPNDRQIASGYDLLYRRNAINETSGGASIASWQFFGQRAATTALGNGLVCSYMNNAQNRSAIQYGQTTPGWGDITTDHLGYDGAGRLIGKRYFNGDSVLVGALSAYDKSSNKLFERPLHAESRANLYDSYDSMNRLLDYQRGTLASGGGSISTPTTLPSVDQERAYNLDGLGNWSTTTFTPVGGISQTETRTHNKLNEVREYGVLPASTSVLYDHGNNTTPHAGRGNGNIVDEGVRQYAYDAFNRVKTVIREVDAQTIAQYTYDAMGRRVLKVVTNEGVTGTVANGTYRYTYDNQQIVEELEESDDSYTTSRQFIWGSYIDELIQMKTYVDTGIQPLPAGTYYLTSDLLYRSTAITTTSPAIAEAYDTDAYGNTIVYSGPGTDDTWFTNDDATSDQPACETIFTGRQYDPETQIYFYRARYYHPQLGRFISRDPAGYEADINLYEAFDGNPSGETDPAGMGAIPSKRGPLRTPTLNSASDGLWWYVVGNGQPAFFGAIADAYIAANIGANAITYAALMKRTDCCSTNVTVSGNNVHMSVAQVPSPGDVSDLVGQVVQVWYNATCAIAASESKNCCRLNISCAVNAKVMKWYTFMGKGLGPIGTPYWITGYLNFVLSNPYTICS